MNMRQHSFKLARKMAGLAGIGIVAASLSTGAQALDLFGEDMYIDVGTNAYDLAGAPIVGTQDVNSTTGLFTEFGFSQFLATSIYDIGETGESGNPFPSDIYGAVTDTNVEASLTALGIPLTAPSVDGTIVDLTSPIDPGQIDIDALSPIVPPLASDNEGFLGTWEIIAEYTLNGTLSPLGPNYTSGTIDLIFREIADLDGNAGLDSFTFLTLDVTSSTVNGVALLLNLEASFAKAGFLWVDDGTGTFVDVAAAIADANVDVLAQLDTDVNPALPTPSELVVLDLDGDTIGDVAVRQTTLDGSIGLRTVPEPSSLALFGLGLLGFAGASRKRLKNV